MGDAVTTERAAPQGALDGSIEMRDTAAYRWIEELIYAPIGGNRFTQRSPIMPDVWIRYGMGSRASGASELQGQALDLLLVANWSSSGAALADAVGYRLAAGLSTEEAEDALTIAQIAPTQSVVAAVLTCEQLLRTALPLSPWWHRYLLGKAAPAAGSAPNEPSPYFASRGDFEPLRQALHRGLTTPTGPRSGDPAAPLPTADFLWLARVAGGLVLLSRMIPGGLVDAPEDRVEAWRAACKEPDRVLDALFDLFERVAQPGPAEPLWSVHRNREVEIAMRESTATVKADAARTVFDVSGRGVRWAVIDTGIDATHVAFRRRYSAGKMFPDAFDLPGDLERGRVLPGPTRILAAYDFSHVRRLMAAPLTGLERYRDHVFQGDPRLPNLARPEVMASWRIALERTRGQYKEARDDKHEERATLLHQGRTIDWDVWEPLLRMPAPSPEADAGGKRYPTPEHPHGTHVAGILAADWHPEDLPDDPVTEGDVGTPRRLVNRTGMCPEIELYDLRVTGDDGTADEFAVLAALQFVRAINARHDHLQIHGVNLSLSLLHEVSNFACGRTPVCEECERLVGNGVVVVAAAGNNGRASYLTSGGGIDEGYRTVSITDPGNAPSVITVGATHRLEPHTYGVSYFSSRGPTGDGRLKPDLVAPGEKVTSTVPGDREQSLDGTSMAAPHVSGAAALLLCRYPELIGKPAEVKRVLCSTATDLGRDRYFQGAGLLDVLRALESF